MASAPAVVPELDARAWEQCVATLHYELGRIASREDCQDAVQEAIEQALHQPELSIKSLGGWVLVTARRTLVDKHRAAVGRHKELNKRRTFVASELVDAAEQRISETELVELLEDGAAEDATEAMARLSAEHQRLLTLAIERTRYGDVADILGISPKAAKARTLRAWGALRQAFIETERGPECATIRRQLVRPRRRGTVGAGDQRRMIAHLETCAPCRAYEKRMKGLIATTPAPSLPFWQQLVMRLEQLLAGAPGPRGAEAAAAHALSAANAGGTIARMLAALCAGATAAGMCAAVATAPDPPRPKPRAQTPRATPTAAVAQATVTPTPTATPTRSPTRAKRNRARRDRDQATGDVGQDTRSAAAPRAAAAPAGSTSTSEFTPSGSGSNAAAPPAPAPAAGGGEFRP